MRRSLHLRAIVLAATGAGLLGAAPAAVPKPAKPAPAAKAAKAGKLAKEKPIALGEATLSEKALVVRIAGEGPEGLPDRVTIRKLDLLGSLKAGLDPEAAEVRPAALRFAGPARAEPALGKTLDCGRVGGGICTIAALGTEEAGAFWVTVGRGTRTANALLVRSEATFWTRDDGARLVVWGVGEGGRPASGAAVTALRARKVVGAATLSADGLAVLALPPAGARTWVHVRTLEGDELLFAHARAPAPAPELAIEILADRPAYAPGDEVRLFAVVTGAPPGARELVFRWSSAGAGAGPGTSGTTSAPLGAAGTASVHFVPAVGAGVLTVEAEIGGRSARAFLPFGDGPGEAAGAAALAPMEIDPGEVVRTIGPRWTRELEKSGGEARIRAVPLPTYTRGSVAGATLFDPGDLAGRAVSRTVEVRFHDDVRYELPYEALSAFGSPSVVYVSIGERTPAAPAPGPKSGAAGATRPRAPLWSFVLLANGTAAPPPLPATEPATDDWVALGPAYVRPGEALPLRAHLDGALGGVVVLEDDGILGASAFGVGGTEAPALSLPAAGAERPHAVTRVGRAPARTLPVLAARHFLGIDLREAGGELAIELYDENGAPVSGEVAVVVHRETDLGPLDRWTPPALRLYATERCTASDGERVWERYFPSAGPIDWKPAAPPPGAKSSPVERGAPAALLWHSGVAVAGTGAVKWTRPADPALLRVTVLAAAPGRVGKRVFFLASER